MNRTDRLYALVEELRARAPRPVRASELAERFEVSVRTIERDLGALLEAGVPLWATRGPNGGYALDPSTTLPPLNLTPREATAVAMALAAAGTMPFAEAGRSARHKLLASMSAGGAEAAAALAGRVRVSRDGPLVPRAVQRAVEDAVAARVVLELDYEDGEGRRTERAVEAHGLYGTGSGWYLIGWCRMRGGGRIFRLDRMRAARATDEPVPERDVDEVLGWIPSPALRPDLVE